MKKLTLLLLLFALAIPAWAQDVDIDQVDPGKTLSAEDLITRFSSIAPFSNLLQQAAEANHVARINMAGKHNTAVLTQSGMENIGVIHIMGNNNATTLIQDGTNLLSLIDIDGSANQLNMTQTGSDLGNLVQVEGYGINVGLKQNKSGFRYIQGGAVNPITITSTRNYVPIIITNK